MTDGDGEKAALEASAISPYSSLGPQIEEFSDNESRREAGQDADYSVTSIHNPTLLTADTAIAEGEETSNEQIELLNSNIERHIVVISRWILAAHETAKHESYWWRGFAGSAMTIRDKLMPKSFFSAEDDSNQPQSGKDKEKKSAPTVSDKEFPPMVEVMPKVEASFKGLDECLFTANKMKNEGDMDGSSRVQSIVERVAQVPSLMKTILLIHKKDDRKRILSFKIVRRVMLCRFTVMTEHDLQDHEKGVQIEQSSSFAADSTTDMTAVFSLKTRVKKSWLVHMLENGYGPVKKIAVDYLELLSKLTVFDHILDEDINPTPIHVGMFLQSQEEIFSEVENLQHLVPAMISLEDGEQERAAVTPIIRRVLDNAVVRPFGISLLFCDLMFHIFILFGWRSVSFRLVDIDDNGNIDSNIGNHFNRFMQGMFFISAIYFVWRLVGEVFSTLITSWQVFRKNFLTFWTLVDAAAVIMAFVCSKVTLEGGKLYSADWFRFFAVVVGFLWLKVLNFLKVCNPSLATFVLAIVQILKDAKFLLLILTMNTMAYGDMFYIIIKTDSEICPADPDEDENPYCSHSLSYLDAFVQILGQFDYGSYLGNPLTIVLFILMTVFGAIIFLNILIAVVSDSYSKATAKSARLFGRARILTVAKIDALEHIMQPKWLNRRDRTLIRVLKLLFKLTTFAIFGSALYWLVRFIDNIDNNNGSMSGAVLSACLMVLFSIGSIIGFSFIITGWGEKRKFPKLRVINDNIFITWIFWKPMVFIMKLVLGLKYKKHSDKQYDKDSDEWSERMKHIDNTIHHSVESSESHLVGVIASLEDRLKEYEIQRAEDREVIRECLASQEKQRVLLENILERMADNKSPSS